MTCLPWLAAIFASTLMLATIRSQPEAVAEIEPIVIAKVVEPVTARGERVTGPATWYGTGPGRGHAAAGPRLRAMLGLKWRGQTVTVCLKRCVSVVVDDWCACGKGRVIDLSDEDFRSLAPLSRGVIKVTVS